MEDQVRNSGCIFSTTPECRNKLRKNLYWVIWSVTVRNDRVCRYNRSGLERVSARSTRRERFPDRLDFRHSHRHLRTAGVHQLLYGKEAQPALLYSLSWACRPLALASDRAGTVHFPQLFSRSAHLAGHRVRSDHLHIGNSGVNLAFGSLIGDLVPIRIRGSYFSARQRISLISGVIHRPFALPDDRPGRA